MVIPGKWAIIPDYGVIKEQTAIDYISGRKMKTWCSKTIIETIGLRNVY